MRIICVWDGSGHALSALENVVPLFRANALSYIEIMMLVWPQRDSAMWRDIREGEVLSGDLHRTAAEVSTAYASRLRAVIAPLADDVHVSIVDAESVPAITTATRKLQADLVFLIVGRLDPDGGIAKNIQGILHDTTVPVWILHAPATR